MLILQRTHQYPNSVIIRAVPQILPSFPVAFLFLLWHAKPLTALPIWSATSPCIPFAQTTGAHPIAGLQVYLTWVTCPDPQVSPALSPSTPGRVEKPSLSPYSPCRPPGITDLKPTWGQRQFLTVRCCLFFLSPFIPPTPWNLLSPVFFILPITLKVSINDEWQITFWKKVQKW